jgi:hypothetical protein
MPALTIADNLLVDMAFELAEPGAKLWKRNVQRTVYVLEVAFASRADIQKYQVFILHHLPVHLFGTVPLDRMCPEIPEDVKYQEGTDQPEKQNLCSHFTLSTRTG